MRNITKSIIIHALRVAALLAAALLPTAASAELALLLEWDTPRSDTHDLFLATYTDEPAFRANTAPSGAIPPQPFNPGFSATGLAVDAQGGWHLLLEWDTPRSNANDLILVSYPSEAAFRSNTTPTPTLLPQGVNPGITTAGLAIDALGGWHLLAEWDTPRQDGHDLLLLSYADAASFLADDAPLGNILPQPMNPATSAAGLAIDPLGGWHLLVEWDTPRVNNQDLFLVSYPGAPAFRTDTGATPDLLPQPLNPGMSAADLVWTDLEPTAMPEPASAAILAAGLPFLRRRLNRSASTSP